MAHRATGKLEQLLEELAGVRAGRTTGDVATAVLWRALGQRSSFAVAAAAAIVGEQELEALAPLLPRAFERFLADAVRSDPGCKAKDAIAAALRRMRIPADDVFGAGVRHRQLEPVWGGRQDTAAALRGQCAAALAELDLPGAAVAIAELLADPEWVARSGAARALGCVTASISEPLLRYKLCVGDAESAVIGDCFRSLLDVAPAALALVAERLAGDDEAVAEQAALALGESRQPAAFPILRDHLEHAPTSSRRRTLLTALVLLRSDEARDFVLGQVATASPATAKHAVDALAIFQHDPTLRARLLELARQRGDAALLAHAKEKLGQG
jgi:HEAT repeat protein